MLEKNFVFLKLFFSFVLFFCLASFVNSIDISNCSNLNSAGSTYNLTANILGSTTNNCINISANNVTLDCHGHLITGNGSVYGAIVVSRGAIQNTNVVIKNCALSNWGELTYRGTILLYQSSNNTVLNITVNSSKKGITIYNANNNNISDYFISNVTTGFHIYNSHMNKINNYVGHNLTYGVYLYGGAYNNFTNFNLYNNSNAFYSVVNSPGILLNNFNITKNINSINLGTWDNSFIFQNGIIRDNLNGVNLTETESNTFTNLSFVNNTNYNVYFTQVSVNNVFHNNYFDNSSKIISSNWSLNTPNKFNLSSVGNTYGNFITEDFICFDAPINNSCDYFANFIGAAGQSQDSNLNSIFPSNGLYSSIFVLIILNLYFIFS